MLPPWLLLCFQTLARVTGLVVYAGVFLGALAFLQQVGLLQEQLLVQQHISCCAVVWENGD